MNGETEKLLLDLANGLRDVSAALVSIAGAIHKADSVSEPSIPTISTETTEKKENPLEAETPGNNPEQPEEAPLRLEDVRAILARKSREGYTAKIRQLLLSHGADKLSAIAPEEYKTLIAEVEAL